MNKTTEALKSIRAILAEPDDEETISKIREALSKPVKQEPVYFVHFTGDFWAETTKEKYDTTRWNLRKKLYTAPVSAEPCKECDAKQAKIDSLMLEYCPDEITDEQMAEWSANQKPVSERRHCGWLCMPNDSHSKKWYPMQEPVKQEPVAWMCWIDSDEEMNPANAQLTSYEPKAYAKRKPLYAASQPVNREWVDITEQQRNEAFEKGYNAGSKSNCWVTAVDAVVAKVKELNK